MGSKVWRQCSSLSWSISSALEAPRNAILSGTVGADVPSLCGFLKILSRCELEYYSDNVGYYSHECFYLDGEVLTDGASELMPSDLSPTSHTN